MLPLPESVIETTFRDYSFRFKHISIHLDEKNETTLLPAKCSQLVL
jgi:hypothetical protein